MCFGVVNRADNPTDAVLVCRRTDQVSLRMQRKSLCTANVMTVTDFGSLQFTLLWFRRMFVLATVMTLIQQVSRTPDVTGVDLPAATDCSGLASLVPNAAADLPVSGDRFTTGNQEAALLAPGFQYETAPGALVIGWNGGHTAVTLPDDIAVFSGEGSGVRIGGAGAYQPQFTRHMFFPMDPRVLKDAPPPADGAVLAGAGAPEILEPPPAEQAPDPAPAGD